MTPKEKAEELYYKIYTWGIRKEGQTLSEKECKELALIAVEEIIKADKIENIEFDFHEYWQEVKQEIQKL